MVTSKKKTALVSLRAYSRHRGCSLSAVQKAVKNGRITLKAGKVDVLRADRQWRENSKHRQSGGSADPLLGETEASHTLLAPDSQGVTYATARAQREHFRAMREKMEFERDRGELVSAIEIKFAWLKLITEAKTRLLGVATKCKARLSGLSAVDVDIIESLIREALSDMADGKADE